MALVLALGGAGVPDSARVPRAQQPAGFWSLRLDLAAPGTPAPPWLSKMSLRRGPVPSFPATTGNPGLHGSPVVLGRTGLVARVDRV